MKQTDLIMAPSRGSAETAIGFFSKLPTKRTKDVESYIREVYRLSAILGMDASILIAHASHETNYFQSQWWNDRLNPAGMGITGDPKQNNESPSFLNGVVAARGHVSHMFLYANGRIDYPLEVRDDPRYKAYHQTYGEVAVAKTISDLEFTWGNHDLFAEGIVRQGNEIFGLVEQDVPFVDEPVVESPVVEPPIIVPQVKPAIIKYLGKPWAGETNIRVNGVLFRSVRRQVTVNVTKLNLRKYAETTSAILDTASKGDILDVIGWTASERVSGEDRWWITKDHYRVWCGGTSEKPS